jgi:effector-binding domain-containing protein
MAESRGPNPKIEIKSVRAKETASIRETISRDDITEALGRIFRAVTDAIDKQGIKPSGAPFARYHSFGAVIDLEAGLPVETPIQIDGSVKPSQLPGGPAAVAVHAGPYEGLAQTYAAIEAWMTNSSRRPNGGPWELYLTDPSSEPDPNRWLTQIIWPFHP